MVLGLAKVGAQNDRNFIRQGNRAYHKQKWAAAETQYRKAISKNQRNAQAVYNLGCALMMQQKDSMAMIQFENASKLETNKIRRARSYHNMGVVMQQHQQYAQAIGCYENALRCNPQDNATRYNLALCKKLLKNQKQNKQNDKNKNRDRIEIITSQNSKGPSRDWLNIVKSTQAKNKINQWFKAELKEDNVVKGKELLSNYCKTKSINLSDLLKPDYMEAIMRKYGFREWDAVLAAIGHGALKEGQIIGRMQELYERDHKKELTNEEVLASIAEAGALAAAKPTQKKAKSGIVVKGIADLSVRFSKCCSPVPGDEIVGFVTRGRGISIHRTDCVNMMNLPEMERARLIDAEWEAPENTGEKYVAEIKIFANNRNGLLADISKALTEKNINILSMNTRTSKQGLATLQTTFEIQSREELNRVIDKIRGIESVLDIERTTG